MINKFSDSVRRNQKQWMVVITILAVFSFVFDDLVRNSGTLSIGNMIFVAVFCAAGMSIIGYKRGKTAEYGIGGLVVGAIVGYIGINASGPPVVVRTTLGNLTRSNLNQLRSRRMKVENFLMTAVKKIGKESSAPRFGGLDDGSMISFSLLQKEARRMGVSITDEAVNAFLSKATQEKLTNKEYYASLSDAGMSEGELFDIVRSELEVQLVAELLFAPADSHQMMAQFTRGAHSGRIAGQTPEQLWQDYRRLHVHQALSVIAVPATDFVKLVPDPTDSEVRNFFDRYKNNYGDRQGTPGFLTPPKVQLAYLVASNLEAFEKQVSEITDAEVTDYYSKNKNNYRAIELADPTSSLPELKQTPETGVADSADPTKPESTEIEKDTDIPGESPPTNSAPNIETPAGEAETAAENLEAEKKTLPTAESTPSEQSPSQTAEESAATETTPPNKNAGQEGDQSNRSKVAESSPVSDQSSAPAIKYQELDDDLKEQIRETILRDKALIKMGMASDKSLEFMMELSLKHMTLESPNRGTFAETFAESLQTYAADNHLEYKETKTMTQMEFVTSLDEQIGSATDPVVGTRASRPQTSVAEEIFEQDSSGRGYRLQVYTPRRADTLRGSRFVYWKILEVPAQIPNPKDEAVEKSVISAWKLDQARPLAEKRAKEFVEAIKTTEADIPAAISGKTINGTVDSLPAVVSVTPRFTWLRVAESLPQFGLQQPVESTIEGIGQPGYAFMKTIFDDLGNGETGVVFSQSPQTYYAVRVQDRDAAGSEAEGITTLGELQSKFVMEKFTGFLPTPYDFIGSEFQQIIDDNWRESFKKRYAIQFESDSNSDPVDE